MNADLCDRLRKLADRFAADAERWGDPTGPYGSLALRDAVHAANLCLDLREAADTLARGCETCRHQSQADRIEQLCLLTSYAAAGRRVWCSTLGNGCNAWEAK